jgi:D-glycero-D-manno-heptose 1,7-bisphosphate phosphatase
MDAGYLLLLVSNQPNYAKGKVSLETLDAIHRKVVTALMTAAVEFEDVYYCLHHPAGVIAAYTGSCICRKPSPYFLLKAHDQFGIDLSQSWMIGDRSTDTECGKAAGSKTIRVRGESKEPVVDPNADVIVGSLAEAASLILRSLP